jgi:hypothetical protein
MIRHRTSSPSHKQAEKTMAGIGERPGAMSQAGLDALLARFPDGKAQGSDHV